MGENCKKFFRASCKVAELTQKEVIEFVWGKSSNQSYWYGNESKTIRAHCIWCARSDAINTGLIKSTKTIMSEVNDELSAKREMLGI